MKIRNVIVRAALFGFSGLALNAYAGPDVKVQGTLVSGACTADFGGSGNLDYGDIAFSSLSTTEWNNLDQRFTTLTINCPGASKNAAFFATDSDHASVLASNKKGIILGDIVNGGHVDNNFNFSLGKDSANNPIGNFSITPVKVTVDGVDMPRYNATTSHTDNTGFGIRQKIKDWSYKQGEDWTAADAKDNRPAGSEFVWTMVVEPQIRPSANLMQTARIPFSGTAKFTVRYW